MGAPVRVLGETHRATNDVPRLQKRRRVPTWAWGVAAAVAVVVPTSFLLRGVRAAPRVDRATLWIDGVKRGTMLREVQGLGQLVPEEVRWLTVTTPARVAEVRLRSGAAVQADTVVVVLDNPDVMLASLEADRQETAARAELVKLEAGLSSTRLAQQAAVVGLKADAVENARRAEADAELARRGFLSKLEEAQSRGRADALDGRVKLESQRLGALDQEARAQLDSQRAQVERLHSIAAFRHEQVENLHVRAGVAGVLQDVPVQVGQWVTAGTLLGKVAQPDRLKAELHVAETQAKDVALGQKVAVDTHDGVVPGRVARMDGAVQNGTVTIDVAFSGPLPAGARPDLSVDGRIEIERIADTLYVGRPAVVVQGDVMLFKVVGNEAVRVPVRLGRSSVKTIEVVSGLNEGDRVILSDTSAWSSADRLRLGE